MKILIDNHNLLGDCIVFMPTLIGICQQYPDADIHVIVGTKTERMLCERCVDGAHYHLYNDAMKDKKSILRFISSLRHEHFDLGITTTTVVPSKAFCFFKAAVFSL